MKQLLYASVALLAMSSVSHAALIQNLGTDPTSLTGVFNHGVGGGAFSDQYLFSLDRVMSVVFASATNDFTGGVTGTDFITGFSGQLFNAGTDNAIGGVGSAADFAVNPVAFAHPCTDNPLGCQELSGSATLAAGTYFLSISGTGGGTSGYGGNITTAAAAVPGPVAGAGIPGIIAAGMFLVGLARRRKQQQIAV